MNKRFEMTVTALLTVAAVTVAAVVVYRQVFARPRVDMSVAGPPTYVPEWRSLLSDGHWVGLRTASVQVVEFGDFQCPYCKQFHDTIEQVIRDSDGRVALVYQHLPLPMHQHAKAAARAADCAAAQGKFAPMAHALYAQQDSIGIKSYGQYARRAGVLDTVRFAKCISPESIAVTFRRAQIASRKFGVGSTPTVIVNGWRLPIPPDGEMLRQFTREIVAGRDPFRGK